MADATISPALPKASDKAEAVECATEGVSDGVGEAALAGLLVCFAWIASFLGASCSAAGTGADSCCSFSFLTGSLSSSFGSS